MSSPAPALQPAAEPKGPGVSALAEIFYSPGNVFSRLTPTSWRLPVAACALLSLVFMIVFINMVGMETLTRAQLEANPRMVEQLGQERMNEMVREAGQSAARKYMAYAMALLGTVISLLVVAGVLTGMNMMAGLDIPFKVTLAVSAFAFWAYSLVRSVAGLAVISMITDFQGFDFDNALPVNLSLLFDSSTTSKFVYSLAKSFDLLSFWGIFLVALGFKSLRPKAGMGKCLGVVVACWLIWVLVRAGGSSMF